MELNPASDMEQKHKYATLYLVKENGTQDTYTYTLADRNHRKELLAVLAALAVGEQAAKRAVVDFND